MKLSDASSEYRRHLKVSGLGKGTINGRYYTLLKLIKVVGDIECARVTARHVDDFFEHYAHWEQSTRNNAVTYLRMFFTWCRERGYAPLKPDPLAGWKTRRIRKKEALRIPVTQWARIFEACETPVETILCATGLFLMLRASEQKLIQVKHVHLEENLIEIYRVKTGDYDPMPIPSELEPFIRRHLIWLSENGWAQPDNYFIPGTRATGERRPNGTFTGATTINPLKPVPEPWEVIQGVLARAGYPTTRQGQHTFRRSGARAYFTELRGEGYDSALRDVQAMLGHESVKSTEWYLGIKVDRDRRDMRLRGKPMYPSLESTQVVQIRGDLSG